MADSVFLNLPQPWLTIPFVGKMLKQDEILCSLSPCIEQVQRSCETLGSNFTDKRTFEVLVRAYEVGEVKMNNFQGEESRSNESLPQKRNHIQMKESNDQESSNSPVVMVRPSGKARCLL